MAQVSPTRKGATRPREGGDVPLRVVQDPQRQRGVRLRVAVPGWLRGGIRLRIQKPSLPGTGRRVRAAVLVAPGELSVAITRQGRISTQPAQLAARLPLGYVVSAMHAGNVRERDAVAFALRGLWRQAGVSKRRLDELTVIIPDQCVRMATIPLEGPEPPAAEGDRMARWALHDILPRDGVDYRIDWATLAEPGPTADRRWLFALAASTNLVREYEELAERLGLSVGRVVPVSLAVAAGSRAETAAPGTARLVLCGMGRLPAALLEAEGVPRAHRAWRGQPRNLPAELTAIAAYARNRLGLKIASAVVAGPPRWGARVGRVCTDLGWETKITSRWSAHRGATL